MKFHERLRELRLEKGMTQAALAKELNYGYTAVSNYESGRNEPTLWGLITMSKIFHVSLDYLLCQSDVRNPYE